MFRLFKWSLIIGLVMLATLLWLALSATPNVTQNFQLSHQDIVRAQNLFVRYDPRKLPPGTDQTIIITQEDLDLAASYVSSQLKQVDARLQSLPGGVHLEATIAIPNMPVRPFLNLSVSAEGQGQAFQVASARVGELKIPAFVVQSLITAAIRYSREDRQLRAMAALLERAQIYPQRDQLVIEYAWDPSLLEDIQTRFMAGVDHRATLAYYQALMTHIESNPSNRDLMPVLKTLFQLADERSQTSDAITENRALLTLLGTWATGHGIHHLLPHTALPARPRFLLRLHNRRDFAQHFLASAAVSVQGDRHVATAVGTLKEVQDTDHGSGFSFTDLAADMAGIRLGDIAIKDQARAAKVQQLMAQDLQELDVMPVVQDLPEYLKGQAFRDQFGQVGSERYQRVVEEIDRRLDQCLLYQAVQ